MGFVVFEFCDQKRWQIGGAAEHEQQSAWQKKNSTESELRFLGRGGGGANLCLAAQITLITNFETLSSGDVYLSHKIAEWRAGKRDSLGER